MKGGPVMINPKSIPYSNIPEPYSPPAPKFKPYRVGSQIGINTDFRLYDVLGENWDFDFRDPREIQELAEVAAPGFESITSGTRKVYKPNRMWEFWLDDLARVSGISETLLDLQNHNLSLSNPLPPYRPRLTQRDREINESCIVRGCKILWPHIDQGSIPAHLQVRTIMAKAKCTAREAAQIADSAAILDSTPGMVNTFCRWARVRGAQRLLDYLYPLVLAVVEVESPLEEKESWESEPVVAGEKLTGIFGEAGICEDVPVDDYENADFDWDWTPEEPEPKGNGDTVAYHVLEDLNEWQEKVASIQKQAPEHVAEWFQFHLPDHEKHNDSEIINGVFERYCSWEALQPGWYRRLLTRLRSLDNLDNLSELGKEVHAGQPALSRDQAGVFWTEYNRAKARLESKIKLGRTARAFIKRIIKADGNLASLGAWLYKVQQGRVKVCNPPQDREWTLIWKAYHDVKEVHATD